MTNVIEFPNRGHRFVFDGHPDKTFTLPDKISTTLKLLALNDLEELKDTFDHLIIIGCKYHGPECEVRIGSTDDIYNTSTCLDKAVMSLDAEIERDCVIDQLRGRDDNDPEGVA